MTLPSLEMKIIYLILTFAILFINAGIGKAVPDRVIIDGGCSKANCVAACDNIPGAFCLGDWTYWIFWEKSKCQCLVP
uniref:Uncharacterized protein n=1 Tax=Strongyloides venezuelensis TaxID=75913 RepID=A0A0K0FVP5_STRVS